MFIETKIDNLEIEADLKEITDSEGDYSVVGGVHHFSEIVVDEIRVYKDNQDITDTLSKERLQEIKDEVLWSYQA